MKQFIIILASVLLLIATSAFGGDGNVDGIGGVDLKDVIMSLRISDGLTLPGTVNLSADVNGDGKIGPPEAIYGLQVVAGLREVSNPNTPLILPTQTFAQSNIRISYRPETENIGFLSAETGYAIAPAVPFSSSVTAEEAARSYLSEHGSFFGLTDQAQELALISTKTADQEKHFVRFQQKYNGIPIIGGEIIVEMDAAFSLMSISGDVLVGISANTTPLITPDAAQQAALNRVAQEHQKNVSVLTATTPELRIYNPTLLGLSGASENLLVWKTEVGISNLEPIYEFVLVNAHTGNIVMNFNQVDTVRQRMTYNANNDWYVPGVLCRSEGNGAVGDAQCNAAHDYAGDVYDFYNNVHGRNSIDNAGMPIVSSVHVGTDFCNAFWASQYNQIVYGDGCLIIADDVVAHEFTHGVTSYTSRLLYQNQSGAINESFSDIWGEFVDQNNGRGNDTAAVRWQMGEDTDLGVMRDMKNPPLHDQPDKVTSSLYAWCGCVTPTNANDACGVHTNSGIINKAAYLMTDGDTFNGYTITGLGYTKVARLFYDAQVNRLTSTSNYPALYNALISACTSLGYSASDCQQIRNALDAVEMYIEPCRGPYYTISGYVRDSSGKPVSGVTMTFSNNLGSTTTDASGYYKRKVYSGWSGNVTPSKSGNTFTPPNRSYASVTSNMSDQNYTVANACSSYTISPTSKSYDGGGGTGSVSVTASSGCPWTAKSNSTWITITSSSSGSGNGSVSYSVQPNTSTSSRNGSITIAGKDLLISQTPCTYGISPRIKSFTSAGGNDSISLTTSSAGCDWTAVSSDNSWIIITSAKSGVGNAAISYSIAQNTGSARTGTITVARQVFTINQDGVTPCTSYSIFPTSQNFDGGGGIGSVNVSASSGCNWTASNNAPSFITITSVTSGSGNGTVSYSVAPNTTTGTRTGTLTIAGQTFTVTQTPCTFNIAPTSKSFDSSGGSNTISVTASSAGCNWTALSNDPSWITITSPASGNGNGTISYYVAPNPTAASRTGTITVVRQTFTITQTAPQIIQFSSSAYSVGEADGSAVITVTRTGDTSGTVSVNYATSNGTAGNGTDYASALGTLTFGIGETTKTFPVGIINDTAVEGNETVNLTLSSPGSGAVLGTPSIAVLTIIDDDVAQRGQIQFNSASYSISESGGSVTITVTRTGGSSGAVGVSYSVGGGTALSGNDYSATSGTITFADGDTADKIFSIPILNDSFVEGNETANLTLSNPTGGATLGTPSSAVLTIADDDSPPTADLFLQNETVTTTLTYTSSNSIWAGYDVTTQKPYGDYVIQSGGNVTLNSKIIYLKPGFKASSGSSFKATAQ